MMEKLAIAIVFCASAYLEAHGSSTAVAFAIAGCLAVWFADAKPMITVNIENKVDKERSSISE